MDESERWMEGEDAAEEELRLLEALGSVASAMQQFNQVLAKLNRQTVELSKELGTAERQLNALYLPFQAAIYEMQSSSDRRRTTPSVPTVTAVATPEAQRTEL
ncbi:Binding-protein-dependent transport systems inner membrane component [Phytophthora cinnamomi]|uniref:Binding-protein-dependent transport systems inner membrane component n=1 Tax=Phytophthora cinnamomi TaxID=4785 RepID=UPI00355AAEE4|nr:Binding-protein-dependent transport systems inner membrane component [Phytophthora cinnamomi]